MTKARGSAAVEAGMRERRGLAAALLLASCAACSSSAAPPPSPVASAAPPSGPSAPSPALASASARAASAATPASSVAQPEEAPPPTFDAIANVLFDDRLSVASATAPCPPSLGEDARVRCLYDERYKGDARAASLAHELYARFGIIAGVEREHTMDGGYRGMIKLVPALPLQADRKQLEWIVAAFRDIDGVFTELAKRSPASDPGRPRPYRYKPLTLRFVRSVAARTPSAYARDWSIGWNLSGSLHTSADAVRETLVHEIFHLNDFAHAPEDGTQAWSTRALAPSFDPVVAKCKTSTPCLAPFTPNDTMVRGGTYYAFQPGNGVLEYGAELALRYFREQRAALKGLPPGKRSFKCGPPESARAWQSVKDEFFGGVDLVPACP